MPEELMIRCEDCGLVFNKITYPECPRCRHLRRKASDILPGALGRADGVDAGAGVAVVQAFLGWALPLILAFLAGGASFMIGVNLSAGLPWNEAPLAVFRVPQPYVVWKKSAAPAPTEVPATVTAPATGMQGAAPASDVLAMDGLEKSLDESNRVSFEGTIRNVSSVAIESARITVAGFDATGTELQSDWMMLAPTKLEPGESGKFRLKVVNHPSIEQYVFKATWTQPVETQIKVLSTLTPPPAP